MYKVGIIGDGYTAAELLRILAGHDQARAVCIFSTENIGRPINQVYPQLTGFSDLVCQKTDLNLLKQECDAVFLALPHGLSVPVVMELAAAGVKCIDLGADFRLKDAAIYEKYYEKVHEAPQMLGDAVYGLPELYREKIKETMIVANPGCFPTSAILPLAPLLKAGLVEDQGIIIDSKSGVSGAGKGLKATSMFCEVNEGVRAYGVGTHRHSPEIGQELSFAAGKKVKMIFTPHLIPMNRGILTTSYSRMRPGVKSTEIRQALEDKYSQEYFVRVMPEGSMPATRWVYGSNFVDIGIYADDETGDVILISALDNLTKGASGQAIQNFNLMMGLDEGKSLRLPGLNP